MRTIVALTLPLSLGLVACATEPAADDNAVPATSAPAASEAAAVTTPDAAAAPCSRAHALHVPAQFPTIQAAVTAAKPGDTVAVAAGTYTESVIMQPGVCLLGAGPAVTVLDAQGAAKSLVDMSIAPGSTVSGFTFRGTTSPAGCAPDPFACAGDFYRAGVFVSGEGVGATDILPGQVAPSAASPALITGNVFADNDIGVMLNFHGIGVVRNNVFADNQSALVANHFDDHTQITNNEFLDNPLLAVANDTSMLDLVHNVIVGSAVAIRFSGPQTGAIHDNVFVHDGVDQSDDHNGPPRFTIGKNGNVDL
jgi:hypothetical protein